MRWALVGLAACGYTAGVAGSDAALDAPADAMIDAAPANCMGAWCLRKAIALHGVIGGPHDGMPVVVDLAADAQLAAAARPDGFDLLFTDAAGTKLSYERVAFVKATGRLLAWVKVPALTAQSVIYVYYGNMAATDQQSIVPTWSAGYMGVWHLEGTVVLPDSTMHGNAASANAGIMLGKPGAIGNGATFVGASGGILSMPKSLTLGQTVSHGTFEALLWWNNSADPSDRQLVMTSSNRYSGPDGYEWASQAGGNHYFYPWANVPGDDYNLGPNPYTDGTWHHAAVTLDFATTTAQIFVDGTAMSFTTVNVPTKWTQPANPGNWLWGGNPDLGGTGYFDGKMDELRVSNVVRSPEWLQTEAANQLAPGNFYSVGLEEVLLP